MMQKGVIIILVVISISIYFQNDNSDVEVGEFLDRLHKTLREVREMLQNKRYPRKNNKSKAKKRASRKRIIKKLANPFLLLQPRHRIIDYTKRQPAATIQNKSNNATTNNQQPASIQSGEISKFINTVVRKNLNILPFQFFDLRQSLRKSANSKQDRGGEKQDKQDKDILDDYDYWINNIINDILASVLSFWAQVEKMITNPAILQPLCNNGTSIAYKALFEDYQTAYLKAVKERDKYAVTYLFAPIYFTTNLLLLDSGLFGCIGYNKSNWQWGDDLCEFYKDRGKIFIGGSETNLLRRLIALNAYGRCISKIDSNLHRIIECFKGGNIDFRIRCREVLTTGVKEFYKEAKFYLKNARDILIGLLKYYMKHLKLELGGSKELQELQKEEIPKFLLYTFFKGSLISGIYSSLYYIIARDNSSCSLGSLGTAISKLKDAYLAVARTINYQGSIENVSFFMAQLGSISYDTFKKLLEQHSTELSILLNPKQVIQSYSNGLFNECDRAIISAVNFKLERLALLINNRAITSHTIYLPDLVDISKFAHILDTISKNGADIFCEGNYGLFNSLYQLTNNIFTDYSQYVYKIGSGSDIEKSFELSPIAAFSKFVTITYPIIKQFQKEVEQLKQKKNELIKGNLSDCEKLILASLFSISDSVTVDIMPMLRNTTEKFVSNLQELMKGLTNSFESGKIDELINLFSTVDKMSMVRKYVSLYIYLTFSITLNKNCENLKSLGTVSISADLKELLEMAYKDELIGNYLKKYGKEEYKGLYEVFMRSIGIATDDRIIAGLSRIGSSDPNSLKQLCVNFKMLDCIRGEDPLKYYCLLRVNSREGICSKEILISDSRGTKVALDYLGENFANCFNNFKCPYYYDGKKKYVTRPEDICPQRRGVYNCPPGVNINDVIDICKYDNTLQNGCFNLASAIIQNTYKVSQAQKDVIKEMGVSNYINKVKECCSLCVLSENASAKLDDECQQHFVQPISKVFTSTELSLRNDFIRQFVCSKKNCDTIDGECKEEVKNNIIYIPTWKIKVPFEEGCNKNDTECFKKKCDSHLSALDTVIANKVFGCR